MASGPTKTPSIDKSAAPSGGKSSTDSHTKAPTPSSSHQEDGIGKVLARDLDEIRFTFLTNEDRSKLFLSCEYLSAPTENEQSTTKRWTRIDLLSVLPPKIPHELLHIDVLEEIASGINNRRDLTHMRRIAKGREPVAGRDGRVVMLVKTAQASSSRESIDPWYFKAFDVLEKGTPLARIYPPQAGVEGITALGEVLPFAPGKEAELQTDDSVTLLPPSPSSNYRTAIANISGYAKYDKKTLQVVHELVISGNVDHHSGDIIFVGSVLVQGDVMKGFLVQAREGIQVKGSVVHGRVVNLSGDIAVTGSIFGDTSGYLQLREHMPLGSARPGVSLSRMQISSAGTVTAFSLENVTLEAKGNVVVNKEIRGSYLHTRGIVHIPNGHILGGEIHSVCGVEAKILGSEGGATTKVTLCSDIESTADYESLLAQINSHLSAEEMLNLYLGPYAENPTRIRLLPTELRKRMEGLRKKLAGVQQSLASLRTQQEEMLKSARHNTVYRINVLKTAYPGVIFCAGEACLAIDEKISGKKTIEFVPAEGKFNIGDYQALECTV